MSIILSPAASPAALTSEPAAKKRTTKSKSSKLAIAEVMSQPDIAVEAEPLPKKRVNAYKHSFNS